MSFAILSSNVPAGDASSVRSVGRMGLSPRGDLVYNYNYSL